MKASIIVITYNEEKNIKDCLESLTKQDHPDYEILVVDASEDKTAEIASTFKTVKVIKAKRKGFGIQRNIGIKLSQGDSIAFTDADCTAPKNWLATAITSLEKHGAAGIGGNAYPPPNSLKIGVLIACLGYPAGGATGLDPDKDPLSTCNAIFLKTALQDVNGFNEQLTHGGEDTDLCQRLNTHGHKTIIDPNLFVYHKTRDFKEFLNWSERRGRAKYHLTKSPTQLLMPLTLFAYPFTSKYRKAFTSRKELGLNLKDITLTVPALFFLRQLYMTKGWLQEASQSR